MKNTPLILSIIAVALALVAVGLVAFGGHKETSSASNETLNEEISLKGEIVYVNLDKILQEYDMANDLRSAVETKVQNIQAEVNRRQKKLESKAKDFQTKIDKGLLTRSVAEQQAQNLQKEEQEFNQYAYQKQQEIQEEQVVMMNQLGDAIKTFIDKYNESHQYAMILTNTGGAPIITGSVQLDITDDVLAGLNDEYIKNKNSKE